MKTPTTLKAVERFCQHRQLKQSTALALSIFVACGAQASGFQVMENSPVAQGMAMAGSGASPDDVTSIANNPAALGFVKKDQVYVGTSYLFADVDMKDATAQHKENTTGTHVDTVSGEASQDNVVGDTPIPAIYGAWAINDQFTAGLSVTVPWGMNTEYDDNSVVRFMAQETDIKSVNLMPMLSYKINPRLSVAAGLQVQYTEMSLSNYNGSANNDIIAAKEATNFKMDGWGTGFVLGVMAQPFDNTYVGLSYRSQVKTKLKGDGAHYFFASGGSTNPNDPFNSDAKAETDLDTPEVVNLSITQIITPEWDVRATAQFTRWSQYEKQALDISEGWEGADTTINYDWHDTWYFALGTNYKLNNQWTVRTGLAWDQTPTSNSTRDARTPDADRQTLAFGASYQLDDNLTIDMAYEHFFMDDTTVNVSQNMGTPGDHQETNWVTANYSGSADIVALGLSYQF